MNYPLRYLIPAMLLLVGLLAAGAVGLTSIRMSNASAANLVTELLTPVSNAAAAAVAAGLRRDNPGRIRNAIEQLLVMRGLHLALLIDSNNQVRFSSDSVYQGKPIDALTEPQMSGVLDRVRRDDMQAYQVDGDLLYFASMVSDSRPRLFTNQPSGHTLLLVYDMAATQVGQQAAAINQALIIGITVLGLSFAAWLFLNNALFGRMSGLVDASRRIGEGELRTPIRVSGRDEIAALGQALDHMRVELSEKQGELLLTAEDLEAAKSAVERERAMLAERVEQRTRELTRTNEALAKARDDAEAASRAKSAFLATVSHEIRTPMNGVLGAMELLERSGLDGQKASLLRTAQESARSLLSLLNDLLDMAKIEAGKLEVAAAPASVESLVDSVVATWTPTAAARRIRITRIVDPDVPAWVVTDAFRVQQVLGNFVSNAVKFTDDGHIEVRATVKERGARDCRLVFTVSDTGVGIEPDALDKLFQPFEQGAVEVARRTGGTGLGLAICRGLAHRLGGKVALSSSPGRGTTASVELPVRIAESPRSAANGTARQGDSAISALLETGSPDVRILVVDDHPVNRLLQVRQVEQLGAHADTASDGIAALAKLRSRPFDIVITDCEMPQMDGFELARVIRDSEADYRNVPIIACTAHALPDIEQRCTEAGMNAVLTKPMRLDDLAEKLRRYWPQVENGPVAPAQPAPRPGDVIDEAALDLLTGGDIELREDMLRAFVKDNREALELAQASIETGNFGQLRELAHRNKGACAIFGALALGDAFAELEHRAKQAPVDEAGIGQALVRLRTESERIEAQLPLAEGAG